MTERTDLAESKISAARAEMAGKIMEWLKNEFDWRSDKDFSRLEEYLKEKGIGGKS